ncbi:TetR/AcrR family transcriptional regulator [Labrenzia sp. CE80]|uniref:TetR/AcrR family transcriptional regulator n=1 Tax=Labrenzia sp. CE80 TaxID=1788986 RepID=UPI00256FDF32|nr:TetR/AcrR family transcriptional regulator [Labrenzia sp. CE80]
MELRTVSRRKIAQQERSKAKVELILKTTLEMLNEGPADQITTNEIAKRANISIGSLYQFFPKKDSIFYELYSRWLQDTLDRLDEAGAQFSGTENLNDLSDAVFDCLSKDDAINSKGHWQLLRAMGSTEELVELEAEHQKEVFQRILSFQEKFGRKIPREQAEALAILQHHVTVGCLAAAAQAGAEHDQTAMKIWCRNVMRTIYDFDRLKDQV